MARLPPKKVSEDYAKLRKLGLSPNYADKVIKKYSLGKRKKYSLRKKSKK